eukprot:TRINITY_DN1368_c0_g2_i2.p1 TRINITY_DN1368_c0_g2~~TRINITY_DN1368_c0_g2_i2.p1  ORF type:complete len:732 (-),score=119.89 TRINITY_DN1368_c0_g2_i2:1266-3152(-)
MKESLNFESTIILDFDSEGLEDIISQCETNPAPADGQFVKVQGTQFTYGGNPFYFMGMNSYHLHKLELFLKNQQPQAVANTFKRAQELGLQVVRLWAFSENLRTSPTDFNEEVFQALDSIIAQAKQYDIKLVLALMNYWEQFNGTDSQVALRYDTIKDFSIEDFFTDEDIKLLYKSQACKIINRENSVTGIKYRDDPTIMAWDLMNEARCNDCRGRKQHSGELGGLIGEWMDEMAAFVKSLDPNHLLTSGSEGFFGRKSSLEVLGSNPGSWAQCTGDDFVLAHDSSDIDYATLHLYPEHKKWDFETDTPCEMECILDWVAIYLKTHFNEAKNTLGKPVVVEEFGLSIKMEKEILNRRGQVEEALFTNQDKLEFFKRVYGMFLQNAQSGDSCGGVIFWTGAVDQYFDYDGFTVYIDKAGPLFETAIPANIREIDLLNTFRKTGDMASCSEEEYSRGFLPATGSSIPPFVLLQGDSVLDVIKNAYQELIAYDVIVSLGDSPLPPVSPPITSPLATISPPPSMTSIFDKYMDIFLPVAQSVCKREEQSVIGGDTILITQKNDFEDCCSACQESEQPCNAFFFCELESGCFDRFIFIPYRSCDLLFSSQIDDGQQPLFVYQGADTELTSGYL